MLFPLKTLRTIFPIVLSTLCLSSSFASEQPNKESYLRHHIAKDDYPMLEFYFDSIGKPRSIKSSELSLPKDASPESQALYYFARIYLERYEGVPLPKIPNLVEFGTIHNLQWVIAEAKLNQAVELVEADEVWQGELLLHDVINISRKIGYNSLQGRAYRWLGNAEVQRSQVQTSLKHYLTAYDLLENSEFEIQIAMTLNNIASLYMELSDWDRAKTYLDQALKGYLNSQEKYDNSLFLAIMYANLSVINFGMEKYEESERYFEEAAKLSMATGSVRIKHNSVSNLSQLLSTLGKMEESYQLAQACLDLPNPQNLKGMKAACYEAFSEAYLQDGKFEQAIKSANLALEGLSETASAETKQKMDLYLVLIRANQQLKHFEEAFNALELLRNLEKSFENHIHGDEMINIKLDLEAKLAQKELTLLEAKNALQASELESQRYREIFYFFVVAVIGFWLFRYIRQMNRINEVLAQENTTDPLTKVHNRRFLPNWLDNMARRSPSRRFALAIIDIDYFKVFNDQYGHDLGDKMLMHVAQILDEATRSGDLLVRWGGEEFVLLFEISHADDCAKTLDRLRLAVENNNLEVDSDSMGATISLGAVNELSAQTIKQEWDKWFFAADQALYDAKQAGRNQYKIHSTS
ncbi:tetratricopeptide repeat-containing diguanylate cyclase [Vibrio harveyi]|uniref:tetratricopeptide repeat-containing diguanylate cyclase n=1 Tax=Vibrio harveyi TaxID=669 RepID=UPI00069FE683|nr:virulence-mediating protein VirC [Vibrio harveyi]HDZ5415755.1 GGDEF domain-containing protein [Vibrio harveyi]